MAQLQSTSITGSLNLGSTTSDTSTCGYLWYDNVTHNLKYSFFNGSIVTTCTFVGAVVPPPYTGI